MGKKVPVFAVMRFDSDVSSPEDAITVKEVLPELDQAKMEVERLNKINAGKHCRYYCLTTRYFPAGRKSTVKKKL